MNVRQYVLVKVQLVIWFQSSLSHETLATCTWLHVAARCTCKRPAELHVQCRRKDYVSASQSERSQ